MANALWTLARFGTVAIVLILLCGSACQRDYRFDTTAQYEVPDGRCRVSIHASGIVLAGDDLSRRSTAEVMVAPAAAEGPSVRYTVALPDIRPDRLALARFLAEAGCVASPAAIAETHRAIDGALGGPKATLMDGQTQVLRVIEVQFH